MKLKNLKPYVVLLGVLMLTLNFAEANPLLWTSYIPAILKVITGGVTVYGFDKLKDIEEKRLEQERLRYQELRYHPVHPYGY